jgi:hypothetical protein
MPLQLPSWQTKAQVAVVSHVPSPSQVCMLPPSHCMAPDGQEPMHPCFSVQTLVQSVSVSHVPCGLQVDIIDDSHLYVFGVQFPVQAPLVQRYGHVASTCQVPSPLQVRRDMP